MAVSTDPYVREHAPLPTLERLCAVAQDALGCRWFSVMASADASYPAVGSEVDQPREDEQARLPLDNDGLLVGYVSLGPSLPGRVVDWPLALAFASHAESLVRWRVDELTTPPSPLDLDAFDALALEPGKFIGLTDRLVELFEPIVGPVRVGIVILDDAQTSLRPLPGSWGADARLTGSLDIAPADLRSNSGRVMTLRAPHVSNHASTDPGQLPGYRRELRIQTILSVPLVTSGRSVGVLHLADKPSGFTADDLRVCLAIAPRLALALELIRELVRLRRERGLASIVSRVATRLAAKHVTDVLLREAVDELRRVTESDVIVIATKGAEPIIAKGRGVSDSMANEVLEAASRVRTRHAYFVRPPRPGDLGSGTYEVPVRLGSRLVGGVAGRRPRSEPFTEPEIRALLNLASLVALSWATDRYQEQRMVLARAEERSRIADDLHDDVAQLEYAAQLQIETVLGMSSLDPEARQELVRAHSLLVRSDVALRNVIGMLAPPPLTDVGMRILEIVSDAEEDYGIEIRCDFAPDAVDLANGLRSSSRGLIVRTAREALTNAVKHAAPQRVIVELTVDGPERLRLRILDDGMRSDCPPKASSHGLASLRATARRLGGTLRVDGRPGGGTRVTLRMPQ